jgi:hypothetical protein
MLSSVARSSTGKAATAPGINIPYHHARSDHIPRLPIEAGNPDLEYAAGNLK